MTLWLDAKRKFNKADFAVTNAFIQSVNVVKETLNRSLSLPDVAGHALGLVPVKKLRLRAVILRDETGAPLADPADVAAAIEAAQRIFEREARTKIIPSGDHLIETLDSPAPTEA